MRRVWDFEGGGELRRSRGARRRRRLSSFLSAGGSSSGRRRAFRTGGGLRVRVRGAGLRGGGRRELETPPFPVHTRGVQQIPL